MKTDEVLTSDELDELIQIAETRKSPTARFVVEVVPYTGLSMNEFLHLRPSWIYWRDGSMFEDKHPEIHVPATDSCKHIRWDPRPPEYTIKSGPCQYCRNNGDTDGFEVEGFSIKSDDRPATSLSRERIIPVRSDRAETALRRWFQTLERPGVPYCRPKLCRIIRTVVSESTISRPISHTTLQWTFIRILAESGVSKENIVKYSHLERIRESTGAKEILEESSTQYEFIIKTIDRLRIIDSDGPVTSHHLAERLGTKTGSERARLRKYLDEKLVIRAGKKPSQGRGDNWKLYKINPEIDISSGIPCIKPDCNQTFNTLRGRSLHYSKNHKK